MEVKYAASIRRPGMEHIRWLVQAYEASLLISVVQLSCHVVLVMFVCPVVRWFEWFGWCLAYRVNVRWQAGGPASRVLDAMSGPTLYACRPC